MDTKHQSGLHKQILIYSLPESPTSPEHAAACAQGPPAERKRKSAEDMEVVDVAAEVEPEAEAEATKAESSLSAPSIEEELSPLCGESISCSTASSMVAVVWIV